MARPKREVCRVVVRNGKTALPQDVDENKEGGVQWQRTCEHINLPPMVFTCLLTFNKAMFLQ